MSANVDIQTETKDSILTVPIQAVTTRADSAMTAAAENKNAETEFSEASSEESESSDADKKEAREVIFLVKDGKAVMKKVKTGIQDNTYIEILEGVEAGDEIVTAPYAAISKKLEDGDPVEVVKKEDLFAKEKKKKKESSE
jgi:HlyD family secretion protein